jgi:hypothetical protein
MIHGVNRGCQDIDNDPFLDWQLQYLFQKVPTIHYWHIDVKEDDVGQVIPLLHFGHQGIERFLPILEDFDIFTIGQRLQHPFDTENGNGIVIHNKYAIYFLH